ncbi:MAG: hypothetical protein FWF02_08165 [Micrococcales bacterium]|nr:hypothetical protein [Micrococcales bacterium]MCL2667665.1 hypothetical protein [Micrococcales bacterium]
MADADRRGIARLVRDAETNGAVVRGILAGDVHDGLDVTTHPDLHTRHSMCRA